MGTIAVENCEYIFQWNIENFSYCWQKIKEGIESPLFTAESIDNSKWRLFINPRGSSRCGSYIGYFLRRMRDDGPEILEIDSALEFLSMDGSVIKRMSVSKQIFKQDDGFGYPEVEKREDVIVKDRDCFLPFDTLSVRCRIRRSRTNPVETAELFARTIISVEKRCFVWNIENFSALEFDQKTPYVIRSTTGDVLMTLNLFLSGGQSSDDIIIINITSPRQKVKYFSLNVYLTDRNGNKLDGGEQQFFSDRLERGSTFPLLFSRKKLMKKKDDYLQNDVLSLNCKCAFSTGIAFGGIVKREFSLNSLTNRNERDVDKHYIDQEENPPSKKVKRNDNKSVKTESQQNSTEKKTDDVFPESPSSQNNEQEEETLLKNSKMRLRSRNLNNIDEENSNLDKNLSERKEIVSKSATKNAKKSTKKTTDALTKSTSRNSSSAKEIDSGKKIISFQKIEGSVKNNNSRNSFSVKEIDSGRKIISFQKIAGSVKNNTEFHNYEEETDSDSTLVSSAGSMKDDEQPSCSNAFVKRNKKPQKKERRSGKGSNATASSSGFVKANEYLTNNTADNSMDTVWSDEGMDGHEGYAYRPIGAPPPTPPADRFDVLSVFKMCDRIQNSYDPIPVQYANDPVVAQAYRYVNMR
ncbi:TD and POZ domain-containing protein 5 [Trichonephila clavata]|uniref:TD and POZ domain-containing protein 5 n=1 Tax=Trichonephila clavata TaxID=2740835 RepID=A0A8X6LHJ2_TRICU|nr:TD and POZ domain-containing protein 5 [Trichonephila clavata]